MVRLGWLGFHQEGIEALEAILEAGYTMDVVITLDAESRAKRSGAVDYAPLCKQYAIPLHSIKNINDPESVALLQSLKLDILFVIGWSQIIHKPALRSVTMGMIGAHASLLPKNRGSAPINWSIINGETETGNSLIWLSEGVDEGDIIAQQAIPITSFDTCGTLYQKVADTNKQMLLKILPVLLKGERTGFSQKYNNEPVLPRRRPSDGLINWNSTATDVYNFIRAITRPYPGAFSYMDDNKWLIWSAALIPGYQSSKYPGEIIGNVVSPVEQACGLLVNCKSGALLVLELEDENGQLYSGRKLAETNWVGKTFGDLS